MPKTTSNRRKLAEARRAAAVFGEMLDQGEKALTMFEAVSHAPREEVIEAVVKGLGRLLLRRPRKR